MGRDAEAARIRLAVSDPLPTRQRQQTAKEKQCLKTGFIEKIFFFFSHKPALVLNIILIKTTDLTIIAHMV
jgi:hypothetical protein